MDIVIFSVSPVQFQPKISEVKSKKNIFVLDDIDLSVLTRNLPASALCFTPVPEKELDWNIEYNKCLSEINNSSQYTDSNL